LAVAEIARLTDDESDDKEVEKSVEKRKSVGKKQGKPMYKSVEIIEESGSEDPPAV
jgi:hypothetical protein